MVCDMLRLDAGRGEGPRTARPRPRATEDIMTEYVSQRGAARLLELSERRVRDLVAAGDLPKPVRMEIDTEQGARVIAAIPVAALESYKAQLRAEVDTPNGRRRAAWRARKEVGDA